MGSCQARAQHFIIIGDEHVTASLALVLHRVYHLLGSLTVSSAAGEHIPRRGCQSWRARQAHRSSFLTFL
jgi:hypothetical protein